MPDKTSSPPYSFRKTGGDTRDASREPQTAAAAPLIDRITARFISMRPFFIFTARAPADAARKKRIFIPCPFICDIPLTVVRYSTISPPPPAPSPQRSDTEKATAMSRASIIRTAITGGTAFLFGLAVL